MRLLAADCRLLRPPALVPSRSTFPTEEASVASQTRTVLSPCAFSGLNAVPADAKGAAECGEEAVACARHVAVHAHAAARAREHGACTQGGVSVAAVATRLRGARLAAVGDDVPAGVAEGRAVQPLGEQPVAPRAVCALLTAVCALLYVPV